MCPHTTYATAGCAHHADRAVYYSGYCHFRRCRARGSAARCDDRPRVFGWQDVRGHVSGQDELSMRDYGLSHHHLLRQDRHAHNFDDDCDAHLRGWRTDDPCRRSWQSESANEGIDQVGYDNQHVGEDGFGQEG